MTQDYIKALEILFRIAKEMEWNINGSCYAAYECPRCGHSEKDGHNECDFGNALKRLDEVNQCGRGL